MTETKPWFPFFPGDFWGSLDVQRMGPEGITLYLFLLSRQWQQGPLPDDPEFWKRQCAPFGFKRFAKAWAEVRPCFVSRDGKILNGRLEGLRDGARLERERLREAGRLGGVKKAENAKQTPSGASLAGPSGASPVLEQTPSGALANKSKSKREREKEESGPTVPNPPAQAREVAEVVEVLARIDGRGTAAQVHDRALIALREAGFRTDREWPVGDRGDGRAGYVDLWVHDPPCAIELDRSSPREKSLTKLRSIQAKRVVVLRSADRGPLHPPTQIDAMVGLGGGSAPAAPVEDVLPAFPALDTPAFRAAWAQWLAYRSERNLGSYKGVGLRGALKQLADMGHDAALRSIEQSIAQSWRGLFPPSSGGMSPGQKPTNVQRSFAALERVFGAGKGPVPGPRDVSAEVKAS